MLSPTQIRRYTPPTCSLEVIAKTSALSQWTGQSMVKELRFELSLDDPRLINQSKIVIQGDRQQLEELVEVVTTYVHNFLQQTDLDFDLTPEPDSVTPEADVGDDISSIVRPRLATKGLLSHQLYLGRLESNHAGTSVQLNATQLFDLANALEDYSAEMQALPTLGASHQRNHFIRWGAIAASLLIAVGIANGVMQMQQTPQAENEVAVREDPLDASELSPQLIPPNPHASYSYTPVPTAENPRLAVPKAPPKDIDFGAFTAADRPAKKNNNRPTANAPTPSNRKTSPDAGAVAKLEDSSQPSSIPSLTTLDEETSSIASENTTLTPMEPASFSLTSPLASAPRGLIAEPSIESARTTFGQAAIQYGSSLGQNSQDLAALSTTTSAPVAQIREYFYSRWSPPEELTETLQYRLTLNPDGTLSNPFPMGKAAELYESNLPLPSPNETIIQNPPTIPQTIRLVIDPDGTMETFVEYSKTEPQFSNQN